jgi:WD40 repeat protein
LFCLAFTCHEASGGGSQCLAYAQSYQLLISAGKRGDICIFDLRQRKRLATSQAHDSHLKALCLDPLEKFYVTGSTEGNIKVKNFI